MDPARTMPSPQSCRGRSPIAVERRIGLALDEALTRQRLTHQGESSQRREESEEPPTGRLGLNRLSADRRRGRVLVLHVGETGLRLVMIHGRLQLGISFTPWRSRS